LPIRISGNTEMKPVIFDADFKLFKTPKDLARSPTVIGEVTTDSLLELIGEEETEDDPETTPAKDTGDSTVTMSLRLIPWQGEVSGVGYYPGYDAMDYGLTAMEMDEEAVRMQLHHRIYFELFKRQPKTPPEPLISPHQF